MQQDAASRARISLSRIRFSTSEKRQAPILGDIALHSPNPANVLDIGSGNGQLLRSISHLYPNAACLGVDFSPLNASPSEGGVEVICADYCAWQAPRKFDLVIAAGVFYVLEMPDNQLAEKLASETAAGGHLIFDLTIQSPANRVKVASRKVLRAFRGPALDRLIGWAGSLFYKGRNSPDFIVERVAYLYITPVRYAEGFTSLLERHGFERVAENLAPLQSAFELRSTRMVFRKL